ncbi:MAG: hypothetical protein LCH52_08325 [Bacteroidetes bacterium]|nr:hypothetical protein [Bacteroidota bacterium]
MEAIANKTKTLLKVLSRVEKGNGWYKMLGGYWELIYPMFVKYCPDDLANYERQLTLKPEHFNNRVAEQLDAGNEEENYRNAVNYMNSRISEMYSPQDIHLIDMGNDEILAYLPNQEIDQSEYWGRG